MSLLQRPIEFAQYAGVTRDIRIFLVGMADGLASDLIDLPAQCLDLMAMADVA